MKYQYKVQGVEYDVEIGEIVDNIAKVTVNGLPFEVEMKTDVQRPFTVRKVVQTVAPAPKAAPAPAAAAPVQAPAPAPAGTGAPVKAPLPGTINEIKVKVGDTVNEGDTVVILEAMKMQNNIEAECSGTITSIQVNQGDTVMEGAVLVTIG